MNKSKHTFTFMGTKLMDMMFLNCHIITERNLEKQKIHTHYPYLLHFQDCQKNRGQWGFDLIHLQRFRYSIKIDV